MADEIELKLALPETAAGRFQRHPVLAAAQWRRQKRLLNLYYDTVRLDLMRAGVSLRLRRDGPDWIQTVKVSAPSAGGLTSRPEWEQAYGGHFDFAAIDDDALRRFLERLNSRGRLSPVFETNFRRTTWRLTPAPGTTVDAMLDRGWIAAAGRRETISEIEIERVAGDPGAIFLVAREFAARVPVAPAQRSKAERGYRLFRSQGQSPAKAETPRFPAGASPARAFREIAFNCLSHLQLNRDGAVIDANPEYIHQVRVATRRLRASLRLFAPLLEPALVRSILPDLREMATLLGRTRDLDVLHAEIVAPVVAALPDEPRLAALDGEITERRFSARQAADAYLGSARYGQAMLIAAEQFHALDGGPGKEGILSSFAARRLYRLRRKVVRLAKSARPDAPASLHALRIAVKRLRYGLEFFAPMAGGRRLKRCSAVLAEAQDVLGKLNDLANAGHLLEECAGADPRLREAVSLVGGWHVPRHGGLMARVPRIIRALGRLRLPRLAGADGTAKE